MLFKWVLITIVIIQECSSQDEDGPYRGNYIGKLNSYHHQVSGDVYAVDEFTILLANFNYDGTGDDTFFWAGDSGRPGPQGFIVPDQHGKTNILERYYNEDVQLVLPEGKRISRIKWFAIYDIGSQNAFGDVYVPDDFEAPAERTIGPLVGDHSVSSLSVRVVDSITFVIPEFRYDGSGEEVYFWTGVGPQPSSRGYQIPDEDGYLEPLRAYSGEDVRLQLPGGRAVGDVKWLSVWDLRRGAALASVLVPERLNVPPALAAPHPHRTSLPHCKQLHRDYQVSWEVFGNQITIELVARLEDNEYMSFGVSGREDRSQMLGADVAVASFAAGLQRGLAADYNISALAPCVQVLGRWRGVCRDDVLGAQDSHQVLGAARDGGLTRVTYRRQLQPAEEIDREWPLDRAVHVVWAVGALDALGEPAYHRLYPRVDVALELAAAPAPAPPRDRCFDFTLARAAPPPAWEPAQLFDPALRVFSFTLGPSGGARGLRARRPAAPALVWYVNGQLAPDLLLRRGLLYTFEVSGGNDPHSATEYHPLVVTTDPGGGLERRPAPLGRVLAGVHLPRRGRPAPTAAGPLCLGRLGQDPRRAAAPTFRAFNRSLAWACAGPPARLSVAPNASWPDVVYYNSFTHADMGGRIYIVDRHRRSVNRRPGSAAARSLSLSLAATLALAVLVARLR